MLTQASHRLPEVLLGARAYDLGRLALSPGIGEEEPAAPVALITKSETQADTD